MYDLVWGTLTYIDYKRPVVTKTLFLVLTIAKKEVLKDRPKGG